MYLKSLELFGFKSFPDRTVLNFTGSDGRAVGATVIVGPNGSGKSNISDAMRWVLGEISSKNIRGTKMEDVIFGGTDDRKQMNFAEVSVTFDNLDRQIDMAFDEVTVTRRYYRRGESEYFINRKPVRLRDIHELFMNTGVGRDGYSIIGQGRIAEIISQKSEERRTIFEEAAGIAKYRYKKEEAETKLSNVDENLTRLEDIMSELEGRVAPLEREAERARKYLEYYEIKKRDDISLWLYDMDKVTAELRAADDHLIIVKNEFDIVSESLSTLENQNERLFEASQDSKYKYEQIQGKLNEANDSVHELENKINLTENNISHRKEQITDRINRHRNYLTRADELEKKLSDCNKTFEDFKKCVEELSGKLANTEELILKNREKRSKLTEKMDAQLASQKRGEERAVELKIRLSVLDTTEKSDSEKNESLEAEIKRYTESSELLSERAEKAEKVISGYTSRSAEIKDKTDKLLKETEDIKKEKQELIDSANSAYLDYTAKKHRIDAIRRMEELFEGYTQSVRFVMSEYDAGRIEGTRPVTSDGVGGKIYGPVSRLIDVSARYVLAVETSLGANIQNIVVDDEFTAKAAISHLKKKNAGRATFYPITSMKPRYSAIPDSECKKYEGYIGTADSMIKYDEKFSGIIRNLLASTLIFDNIDNASVMAKATGYKTRIVTLDGQVINAGGSFTGGSAKRDSGMLTRKSETEKLKNDVAALSKTLEDNKHSQSDCDRRISEKNREIANLSSQSAMLSSLLSAENTQLEVIKSQLSGEKNMIESLKRDLEKLRAGFDERAEGIAKLQKEVKEIEEENLRITEIRESDTSVLGDIDILLEELEAEKSEYMISRAETLKDVEVSKAKIDEINLAFSENKNLLSENEKIRGELENANLTATAELENMRTELLKVKESVKVFESERSNLSVQNVEYETKINQLRGKIREKTSEKELAFRNLTIAESKRKELSSGVDKLTSRLWEDYELTYTSAKECGYPSVNDDNRQAVIAEQNDYRAKLKALGGVNLSAIDEYTEVKKRYDFMSSQINDLKSSKENLLEIIFKLEVEMRETFISAFREIDRNFKEVFAELFGGGSCELSLTDPENVLESGIEIKVAPPGKIIKSLMLLSGGEQAFVAIALIFAILRVNPTPFCIFDEIEAALDESNVFRFADYLKRYSDKTQFIVITHRRGTMEAADRLYGVTMQERGISKVLTLDIKDSEYNPETENVQI